MVHGFGVMAGTVIWLFACAHSIDVEATPMATPASTGAAVAPTFAIGTPPESWTPRVAPSAEGILAALADGARTGPAFERLATLCDRFGPRMSGSPGLEQAVRWTHDQMKADGIEVWLEEVQVPVWVRGAESLEMTAPHERKLAVFALGGSIGTVPIEAPVVVVSDFGLLTEEKARGKIVLWNAPMTETTPTVHGYGDAVKYRVQGASKAAALGAVASLVRSVTTRSLYTPHTGMMRYADDVAKIPSAAITVEDAELIDRLTQAGVEVRLRLALGAETHPDATSHNVVGQVKGAERPDEVVLLAAHLDSWDVDPGAHDDGAGVVHVMEALRLIQALPDRPRRTIRGVLFTNEENGLRGGKAYYDKHAAIESHVLAIESDLGGGWPLGFGVPDAKQRAWLAPVVGPIGLPLYDDGGGADIGPFEPTGILLAGLRVDDRHYFDVHHTLADTIDKVDPPSLREGAAALAALAWQVANAEGAPPPRLVPAAL